MNLLRLSYEPEDDWHGELRASIQASGFHGQSSAWFNRETLAGIAHGVEAYPLMADAPVTIRGGVGVSAEGLPKQVHLGLTVLPYGRPAGFSCAWIC